jgi:integrase
VSDLSRQTQGKETQGDYRPLQDIEATKQRLKENMTKAEFKKLEQYEVELVKKALADTTRRKNFAMIWSLTKMLDGKNWLKLTQRDIDSLVMTIMKTHGKNGKDSATSSDNKRFLKVWYRFVKLGSRDVELVGDPKETRGIRATNVYRKLSATDMIPREDIKKVIDSCTTLRDKALIDFAYDSGKRIGEVLSIKIKDIQVTKNGYVVKTDGKTGVSTVLVLECLPTLAAWLEGHPNNDDPEAWLFPNEKHIWKGNKLAYNAARSMLLRAVKVSGIKRKIFFQLMRHSAATRAAKYMPEGLLKDRFAWSATSKMPSRYTHLNVGVDANNAYLKAHGIEPAVEENLNVMPVMCPICKTPNSPDQKICQSCAKPLSTEMAVLLQEEKDDKIEQLENSMSTLTSMMKPILDMLNSTKPVGIPMKFFPKDVQQQLEEQLNHS